MIDKNQLLYYLPPSVATNDLLVSKGKIDGYSTVQEDTALKCFID